MSFTNAPVTRCLVVGIVASSIAASLFDAKHYFYILVDVHFWRYWQWWRVLIFQLCYTNSAEALFAATTLYHMRLVERMWGPRKYASFIFLTGLMGSVATPAILTLLLRPLTRGFLNYLPAGPTPIIFAILAQYHAMVPVTYQYRVSTSTKPPPPPDASGQRPQEAESTAITFSNKSFQYALALNLAALQWPGSILGAAVGWVLGYAWRMELLPQAVTRWRLPQWLMRGRTPRRDNAQFEQLRRRLEGEGDSTAGAATGAQGVEGQGRRRTTMGQQILHQVQEAF